MPDVLAPTLWRLILLTSAALLMAASRLTAQAVRGVLRSATDREPVAGALVIVSDSAGQPLARTVSGPDGAFALLFTRAIEVRLTVLRIGQRPFGPTSVTVPATGSTAADLMLPDRPVLLAALNVTAERNACGPPAPGSTLALLLEEARKAITLTQATLDERRIVFDVETWRRGTTADLTTLDSIGTVTTDRGWPIRSAPLDSLRRYGFVREERDAADSPFTVYYGPDANVLFADWFAASRCLRIVPGAPGLLTVQFRPAERRTGSDIRGHFVFDSTTLALRELEWHWTSMPFWVPEDVAGGTVRFQRTDAGAWIASSWMLRAPVPIFDLLPSGSTVRLRGYFEFSGRVTRIR